VRLRITGNLVFDETLHAEVGWLGDESCRVDFFRATRLTVERHQRLFGSLDRIEAIKGRARFALRHLDVVMDDEDHAAHERTGNEHGSDEVRGRPLLVALLAAVFARSCAALLKLRTANAMFLDAASKRTCPRRER